jgi:hypothetical protein
MSALDLFSQFWTELLLAQLFKWTVGQTCGALSLLATLSLADGLTVFFVASSFLIWKSRVYILSLDKAVLFSLRLLTFWDRILGTSKLPRYVSCCVIIHSIFMVTLGNSRRQCHEMYKLVPTRVAKWWSQFSMLQICCLFRWDNGVWSLCFLS